MVTAAEASAVGPADGSAGSSAMPATLFTYRSGRRERLDQAGPTEFLYGFPELRASGDPVDFLEEVDIGATREFPRVLEAFACRIASLTGVHPRLLVRFLAVRDRLNQFGCIVATTQSVGLALAALQIAGLLKPRVIMMTMGLLDGRWSTLRRNWFMKLLSRTTLAALSKPEARFLQATCPELDVADFQFGIDANFWFPLDILSHDIAISVGNDRYRDFETLVAAWRPEFPPLEIITSLPVKAKKDNVQIVRGDWRAQSLTDEDLRDRIRKSRLVIVPLVDTLQPSGQSAALQAMACGRPVILTANRGIWDRDMLDRYEACRLVAPGQPAELANAIADLLQAPDQAAAMGMRARRMIENERVTTVRMAEQIRQLVRDAEARTPKVGKSA